MEYWPHGLEETGTLEKTHAFLKENFKSYIDLDDYENGNEKPKKISDIEQTKTKLNKIGPNSYTDIFLIK